MCFASLIFSVALDASHREGKEDSKSETWREWATQHRRKNDAGKAGVKEVLLLGAHTSAGPTHYNSPSIPLKMGTLVLSFLVSPHGRGALLH